MRPSPLSKPSTFDQNVSVSSTARNIAEQMYLAGCSRGGGGVERKVTGGWVDCEDAFTLICKRLEMLITENQYEEKMGWWGELNSHTPCGHNRA
jgi:hypothetical protein